MDTTLQLRYMRPVSADEARTELSDPTRGQSLCPHLDRRSLPKDMFLGLRDNGDRTRTVVLACRNCAESADTTIESGMKGRIMPEGAFREALRDVFRERAEAIS